MDTYTVSFFGHRKICYILEIEKRLVKIIDKLISQKEYVEFLVGRDGDFDILVSSVIKRVTRKQGRCNSAHVLVLPYMRKEFRDNEKSYLNYFDEVEICEESSRAYFKSAIPTRNKNMVNRSDLIVCYVNQKYGGAYAAMQYAIKQNKKVINIAESIG